MPVLWCGVETPYWKILDCRERSSVQEERLGAKEEQEQPVLYIELVVMMI